MDRSNANAVCGRWRAYGVVALALLLLFGLAAPAGAAQVTSWTGIQPTGTMTKSMPVIITGTTGTDAYPLSASTVKLYVDGALIPRASYTATVLAKSAYFKYTPAPALADGAHTFRVEVSDTAGKLSFYQWGATVAVPPTGAWMAPIVGSTSYTGNPPITVWLSDNTPGANLSLAAQVRAGSASGTVVRTLTGSQLQSGLTNLSLSSELAPGTYYLTGTVTDGTGLSKVLTPSVFYLASAPAMSVMPRDCTTCHPISSHQSDAGCPSCHAEDDHGSGLYCSAAGCHPRYHENAGTPCVQCHVAPPAGIPAQHSIASIEPAHAGGCDGCHTGSLVGRHTMSAAGSVYSYQCDTCHASADPAVTAAIAAGDTACAACHDADHVPIHDTVVPASCEGSTCHAGTNLVPVHRDNCARCHDSTDVEVVAAIAGNDKACSACHAADHVAVHETPMPAGCAGAGCHTGTNLSPLHGDDCAGCHDSEDTDVIAAIAGQVLECGACHADQGVDYHTGMAAAHASPTTVSCFGAGCHDASRDLATVHELYAGPGSVNPDLANECALCHGNPAVNIATSGSSCTPACHSGATHSGYAAGHAITSASAGCTGCHDADLAGTHGFSGANWETCGSCHSDPANGTKTADCESCHVGDQHPPGTHEVGNSCITSGCHPSDAKVLHDSVGTAGPGCDACHGDGITPSFSCGECHATPHADENHGSAQLCEGCHSTGNLMAVHGDDCATCHPTPAVAGFVYTGCEQSGCHPGTHDEMSGHHVDHGEGEDCMGCHPGELGCENCHAPAYERVAPITTSDARALYTSYAVIHLTATEQGESGITSGIKATYAQLDGGPTQALTTIVVPAPATGVESHTLEYWSVDNNLNAEVHRFVRFSVAAGPPDTSPPTGTMSINSGATYTGTQSVTVDSAVTDAETGIVSMRIDTGTGTFGSWRDFSPSVAVAIPTGNGEKTVRVEYQDAGANTLALTDTIVLDQTPPTGSVVINGGAAATNNLTLSLTVSATDLLSGVAEMRFLDNYAPMWSAWMPYATSAPYTLFGASGGARTVYVQFKDNAGVLSSAFIDTIVLDRTAPTGSMSVNGGATYTLVPEVSLRSAVTDTGGSGLATMRVDPGTGTFGPAIPYAEVYPFTLAAGEGLKTVRAEYADGAGGTLSLTYPIVLGEGSDALPPSGSVVINAGATATTNPAVTLTLAATDVGGSGVAQMRVSNDDINWSPWETYTTSKAWTLTTGVGTKPVYVQYRDHAGNTSASHSDSIIFDNEPPVGTISINAGAEATTSRNVTLSLSSNADGYRTRFSNNGTSWSTWQVINPTQTWTLTVGLGVKTVYAQFMDVYGNVSVYWDTITLIPADTTPPTGSVVINGGASATSNATVTLTLAATDTGGSGLSQMRFSTNNLTWGAWESYATSKSWVLSAGDGVKYVYVQFRDVSGNMSPSYGDSITLATADTTPPTGSISINGGGASTTSQAVTLNLSATDAGGSGLSQMRFSNDNSVWTAWTAYAATASWTLTPGVGTKTVYVQYRDSVGNASTTYSDTILLEEGAGGSVTTSMLLNEIAWVDANENASGAWATYSIFVNDVLVGTKNASADPTWACPQIDLPSGGHIDIVVDCGFTDAQWVFDEVRPITLTMALPAGTVRLEAATWTGFPNFNTGTDWWDDYNDYYAAVWAPTAIIGNIVCGTGAVSDTTPPTGSILINGGAASTAVAAVTLNLSATDTGGSGLSQMQFSNDNSTWSTWETYATTRSWTLTAGGGTKTVYARYRDATSNVSATYSDTITLIVPDTTAPTGSISINSGAASTAVAAVTLNLSATDTGGSGLSQMQFSNDNSTWSTWETYATTKSWTLAAGDGTKTVYARYRDVTGNVSTTYSDTITLATVGTATLSFQWWGYGYAELHVENASGAIIASTSVEGSMSSLMWNVSVPSGANYRMVCDYYWDDDAQTEGSGWVWSNDTGLNADGILSPGETVIWNY